MEIHYSSGWFLLVLLCVFEATPVTNSAPLNSAAITVPISNNLLPVSSEEDPGIGDDDFTTHGLSSAATCLVAGIEYTHGQQIYRVDQCEYCLCLDGEMFCWWQECPPEMESPCKDRGPFTPCSNTILTELSTITSSTPSPTTTKENLREFSTSHDSYPSPTSSTDLMNNSNFTETSNNNNTSPISDEEDEESSTELDLSITTQQSKFCVIMGRKYEIGAKLPHNTGNCIECICGSRAKVSCSPYQCAPAGEEINDYRPPGSRQQIPDVF